MSFDPIRKKYQDQQNAPALFKPLEKTVRTSQVLAGEIRKYIVQGKFKPGQSLPSERDLAKSFQVTRTVVREAVRSLEQLRLVSVRQGGKIRVLDYLASAGIEFAADLLLGSDEEPSEMMKDIADAWWVIGRAMMFYAVENFKSEDLDDLLEAVLAYIRESDKKRGDYKRLQGLDYEVQNRLMRSTGNRAMILLHNSMRHVYSHVADLFTPIVQNSEHIAGNYTRLMYHLSKKDVKGAKKVFESYFNHGREALRRGDGNFWEV
ncbi:transcriptional regulator, GntR family [Desulfatibacillum alkenivorans DSM 16219]|jgi:DNA-binding FadR family transcriptional regulator|uniref:Transcriptional regulator, GntR family n=1 Tax=Desulfatibacillum alkenivorans DSM 16219 TaxID=1121393 RepID=A0A1M7B0Y8_9BACT|nr:GntR family transcriptional regulator [Desulfatibacillum alkenivorans]SHL48635.1 transcriptional regulator, GntR family [Desulfatibacillum alkenivorans DSM 16219]